MHVTKEQLEPTKVKLTIIATPAELDSLKQRVIEHLSSNVRVQGFRPGKAPAKLVEKQLDPAQLQTEFLDHAVNDLYVAAVDQQQLRPVAQPAVSLTKFVPYTTLEFTAEVDSVGDIKVPDYKKITLAPAKVTVSAADISGVLESLQGRGATKEPVARAAKSGDETVIDFAGADAKTKEPIAGADGQDYPLLLGGASFIPGFEDELIGQKAGATKEFTLTFPKDYGVPTLQSRKVTFTVTVKAVNSLTKAKLDDAFAKSVGPFKDMAELKADIKKQITAERQREADQKYDNDLLEKIAAKTVVAIPDSLINEEIDRLEEDEKRNLVQRGQTWQEHLDAEGLTAEAHREQKRPPAELRVKSGLILGVVADKEKVTVSPEELEIRVMLLKNQYASDSSMQEELDKPEGHREIHNRMLIEKTLDKLREFASKATKN